MADSKIAPRHLLAVSGQLVFVRSPLLVFELALGPTLLALRDADEGVDDADEKESADDAAGDNVLRGLGKASPLLLGFLPVGELVECFVDFGFAPDGFLVDMFLPNRCEYCLLGDLDACVAARSIGVRVGAAVGVGVDDLKTLDHHGVGTASTLVVVVNGAKRQVNSPSLVIGLATSPLNDTRLVVGVTTSPKTQVDVTRRLRVPAGLVRCDGAHLVAVEPELQLLLGPDDSVVVEAVLGVGQHRLLTVVLRSVALSVPVVEDVRVVLAHDLPIDLVQVVGQQVDG